MIRLDAVDCLQIMPDLFNTIAIKPFTAFHLLLWKEIHYHDFQFIEALNFILSRHENMRHKNKFMSRTMQPSWEKIWESELWENLRVLWGSFQKSSLNSLAFRNKFSQTRGWSFNGFNFSALFYHHSLVKPEGGLIKVVQSLNPSEKSIETEIKAAITVWEKENGEREKLSSSSWNPEWKCYSEC